MCFILTVFTVNVIGCDCYQSDVGQFRSIVATNIGGTSSNVLASKQQEVPIFILGVTNSASAAARQCDFVHVAAAV